MRSNGDNHSGFTSGDGLIIEPQIAHALTANGADASEDGTGRGTPLVAYNLTFCDANGRRADRPNGGLYINETEQANTLTREGQSGTVIASGNNIGVRRLSPVECERLQGFPPNWTACGDNGAPISDSARYRMLGNAICLPVAEWIARRLVAVGNAR